MIRKAESSTATAFFSNEDFVSISAENDDDPTQQASAEVLKPLVQCRLTRMIKWFQTLVGARQDAEVMGICVAKVHCKYKERHVGIEQRLKLHPLHGMPNFDEDDDPEMEDVDPGVTTWAKAQRVGGLLGMLGLPTRWYEPAAPDGLVIGIVSAATVSPAPEAAFAASPRGCPTACSRITLVGTAGKVGLGVVCELLRG